MDSPIELLPLNATDNRLGNEIGAVRIGVNEISFSSATEEQAAQRRRDEKLAARAAKRCQRVAARDDRRAATAGTKMDGGSLGVATADEFTSLFGAGVKGKRVV